MASWPADWINRSLAAAKIESSGQAVSVLRAWKNSTPLPPLSNNPLGFPAGAAGAPSYLGTAYAIFPSMAAFYAAFAALATSPPGRRVRAALAADGTYPQAWRAISALAWPASATETDWPAGVLELTAASYQAHAATAAPAARKTSGIVGAEVPGAASALDLLRSLNSTVANANDALTATRIMIKKGIRYG